MCVRKATLNDVSYIHDIETSAFSLPWSTESIINELNKELARVFVLEYDKKIVGWAGFEYCFDEASVTNIAVLKEYQNKHFGQKLVETLISECKYIKMKTLQLEVRKSNVVAIHLYEKLGFKLIGERKNFYEFPRESALIYLYTVSEGDLNKNFIN